MERWSHVRHTIYEDPVTHKFALVRVPANFIDGDKLEIPATAHWLTTPGRRRRGPASLFEVDEDIAVEHQEAGSTTEH